MKSAKAKILIIIGIFVLLVTFISIIYLILNNKQINNQKDSSETITYIDPGSGETIITTPNKIPETVTGEDILTLGFTSLIDRGMTKNQVDKLKSYFLDYSNTLEKPISEVSISISSIGKTVNNGVVDISFNTTIDREQTIQAKVKYLGLDNPSLVLYKNKKEIFKSN